MMEVYTIGYTAFKLNEFVNALKSNNINCLIDVRSMPYSKHYSEYNKEAIEDILKKNKIIYRNYAKRFGARQDNREYYDQDGILEFKKFIKSNEFQSGVKIIKDGIGRGYSFAFMCAEKDPINCHRSIMVGQGFKQAGFTVKHIESDNTIETQEDLEQKMLNMYFPDRGQMSLFSNNNENEEALIEKCYELRNKAIGYHIDEDNGKGEY